MNVDVHETESIYRDLVPDLTVAHYPAANRSVPDAAGFLADQAQYVLRS